jgi:lipopolysaccharide transport system permease protein
MADAGVIADAERVSAGELSAAQDDVVVREHRPTMRGMVADTWHNRHLILPLGIRQIIKGFSGTRIGRPWLVLRPLMSIFGMSLIFGSVLRVPTNGVPYLLFLLIGMTGWLAVERMVFWATRSFDIYRKVAGRLEVPVLLVPAAAVAPMLMEVTIMSSIAAGTAIYYTVTEGSLAINTGPTLILAPAGYALGVVVGFGIGLWLAVLNAMARDVRLVLRYFLQIWLFVTPVIYATDSLPGRWRFIATLNPAAAPVELVKMGLLDVGSVTAVQLAVSFGACLLFLPTGLWFVTRLSPKLLRAPAYIDEEEEE